MSMGCAARLFRRSVRPSLAIALAVAGWCLAVLAYPSAAVPGVAHYLAAEVFVVAGAVCLARWRLRRRAQVLHSAVALVLIGIALPAVWIVAPWTTGDAVQSREALVRVAVLVPVFLILGRVAGPSVPQVGRRSALLAALAPVVGVGVFALVLGGALSAPLAERTIAVAVEIAAALAWTLLAWHRRGRDTDRSDRWTALGLAFMAGADAAAAIAVAGAGRFAGVTAGLQLAAAVTVLCAAGAALLADLRTNDEQSDEIALALVHTQRLLAQVEGQQRARLHDARSAAFGVIGASRLLGAGTGRTADHASLQQLITAELGRLQGLLVTDTEAMTDFVLGEAVSPVLFAHQIDGADLRVGDLDVRVHGRPRATATIVDNLVRNARTHAPGASIAVTARCTGVSVSLQVADDGPGIPRAERDTVLLAGVRGSSARGLGSGLGLHNCLVAARAQGGALEITDAGNGGTCITVRLPVLAQRLLVS